MKDYSLWHRLCQFLNRMMATLSRRHPPCALGSAQRLYITGKESMDCLGKPAQRMQELEAENNKLKSCTDMIIQRHANSDRSRSWSPQEAKASSRRDRSIDHNSIVFHYYLPS